MSHPYVDLSDADLWEYYRDKGLSATDAELHVQRRAQAQQGPDLSAQEMTEARDVGPGATAAQNALDYSPASIVDLPGTVGRAIAAHPLLTSLTAPWALPLAPLAEVPENLLGRGEALAAGLPYGEFQQTKATSDEQSPTAALLGKAGGIATGLAPTGVGMAAKVGSRLTRMAQVYGDTKLATLEGQQLRNALMRGTLESRKSVPAAPVVDEGIQLRAAATEGAPPDEPVHPDVQQAMADFDAGKISGEDLRTAMDVAAGRTPPEIAPAPRQPVPRVSGPQAIPGSPKGISVVGPPTPPVPTTPTIAEMQSGRGVGGHSYTGTYPQGSGVADLPGRPSFTPAGGPSLAPGQLKALLDASPAEFDAAAGMLSPDIAAQIQALRAGGATGAHVEAAVGRMGAPSFSGGGFQGISEAMNTPAYQQAGTLAARILKDPKLLAQYPQFAGQNPEAATATLQRMLVEHARSGGTVPAITSLSRFLGRLAS